MLLRARRFAAATALALSLSALGPVAGAPWTAARAQTAEFAEGVKSVLAAWAASVREPADRAAAEAARAFYAKRENRSLWFEGGTLRPRGQSVLDVLAKADQHGLRPANYGMPALAQSFAKPAPGDLPALEVRLTRLYLEYAGDVSAGRISKVRQVGAMFREPKRPDPGKLLTDMAAAPDAGRYIEGLAPDPARYGALKKALAEYRALEAKGGWARVADGPAIKPGAKDARVPDIRKRLAVSGEYKSTASLADPTLFDDGLVAAVKKFQERHGLKDDGAVGTGTIAEMNVPVRERVEQIVINMERRRWMAGHLGERYIFVNIADNDLKVVEKDKTIYEARVVVGRPYHETPVFSAMLQYIEMNPWWNVPHSIATQEMLPVIKRVPGYLEGNDYLLLTRMGDNNSAVNSASVNWNAVTPERFPYFIRQKPGPRNALGTTLFMFPNGHNVFIHDTPMRSIFNMEDRYFSHGCVRVEHPMKLAMLLLRHRADMTERRLQDMIDTKQPQRVDLKDDEKIMVHISYFTAWAERDGTVHFRKDVYRRDPALKRHFQIAQGENPPPLVKPTPKPGDKKG